MTYYEILEVRENASETVIHMAYKALAKKYHPDVFEGSPEIAEAKMKQLNMAYSVLSDKEKRAKYDAYLSGQQSFGSNQNYQNSYHNEKETETASTSSNKSSKKKTVALVVIIAILILCVSWFALGEKPQNIEQIKDSVVMIEVYNGSNELVATGSGFCAYKSDWIVTNFHVIEGAKKIKIITDDHQEILAENIVLFNKSKDLAILSIDGALTPLKIGDGNNIKTKDNITTIGSPKGQLNTVSEGIISNVDNKDEIRITAPISHGSSGGVLLNKKNEVIGITSAGYDDAQNLNFAINVSILDALRSAFEDNKVTSITNNNFTKYIGSLNAFADYMSSDTACYSVSSISVFHLLTNDDKRFEYLLEEEDYSWYSIYDSLSSTDKADVLSIFVELGEYDFNDNNVKENIKNWDVTDFFISLDVLNRYEYAITVVDLSNYYDNDSIFNNVNDNYPLEAAEKSLILYLIGNHEWSEIHTDNKEDIFDYFDARYWTDDFGAILEMLGYEVEYNSDGTLTAYW